MKLSDHCVGDFLLEYSNEDKGATIDCRALHALCREVLAARKMRDALIGTQVAGKENELTLVAKAFAEYDAAREGKE